MRKSLSLAVKGIYVIPPVNTKFIAVAPKIILTINNKPLTVGK